MPTYINERPVKTGCWTDREDELLAEWQGKYGNRYVPLSTYCCALPSLGTTQLRSQCVRVKHDTISFAYCFVQYKMTFAKQCAHTFFHEGGAW